MGITAAIKAILFVASILYQNKQQKKLKQKQAAAEEARKGFMLTIAGEAVSLPVAYGKNLLGGIAVKHHITSDYTAATVTGSNNFEEGFTNETATGTKNEFLHVQYALCHSGVDGVVGVKVNDLDYNDTEQRFNHLIRTYNDGGVADPVATANGILPTNTFTGAAYASATFKLDRDDPQYNGVPNMGFLVKGRKVREVVSSPYSLGAYIYSNNPALCLLDYLLNADFGRGLSEDEVDLKSFYEAALVCGTTVSTGRAVSGVVNGGTTSRDLPLYECNITLSSSTKIRENIEAILNTMALAELTWSSEGKYKLLVEHPTTLAEQDALVDASHYFTDDDIIRDSIDLAWPSASERYNQVTVTFSNEHEDFKDDSATWPKTNSTAHSTYLTEDNYQPFRGSFDLGGVTDPYHALAAAEQFVRDARSVRTIALTVTKKGLSIEPGDFINITSSTSNISSEVYRVQAIEVNEDFTVKLTCTYFDYTTLAWNVNDDIAYSTRPVYDFTVEPVTNLTYTAGTPELDHTAIATLSWVAPTDGSFKSVVYYTDGAGGLKTLGETSTTSFFVRPKSEWTNGQPVTFTVKAQTPLGRLSKGVSISNAVDWSPAPLSLSATGTLGFINISWINPADLDLNFVEIWESVDSNINNATQIAKAFGDHYSRGNLFPLTTRYYWVRAVDFSGNRSDFTGPEFATTSQITNADLGPATIQYDNFASDVTLVFDDIMSDLSDRVLTSDYNITVGYQQQLEHATTQLAEDALTLALNASSLESRINDAGITVDPATGSVTIQGLSAIEDRVNTVEVDLDAVEGELTLKATTSYVNSAIAAATLPEATLDELVDLEARVGVVEVDLNSVEGSITLASTGSYYNVNDGVLGVEALEGRISINEGEITLKASQTELGAVETRLGSAEITLNSIDAPSIALSVQDIRSISEKQDDLAELTLSEVLGRYKDREYLLQDSAYARLSLTADVNDEREARAASELLLSAEIGANKSILLSEQVARADADSALAFDITQLEATVVDLDTDVVGTATAVSGLTTRVDNAEGTITAQSSLINNLSTTVGENTASVTEAATSIDGIEAKYGVSIDNNGNAAGFQLLSGVSGSAFNVRADQFAVWDAENNGGVAPFTIFTSPRTVNDVVYPAGTYIKNAIIDEAAIVSGSITNVKIKDAAIDTLKVAGDSVTITSFVDFATQSGSGPYTFSTNVNMAYDGDIVAIATIKMFGSAGSGDTARYQVFIDGLEMSSINYTGPGLLGLQNLSASKSVSSGSRNITVTVSNLSGISSPSADCQLTLFRRYR